MARDLGFDVEANLEQWGGVRGFQYQPFLRVLHSKKVVEVVEEVVEVR